MGNVRCVFCRKTRKRAKEHIWPKWLQEAVEGGTNLRAETHYAISGGVVNQRTLQNESLVLGQVCMDCNNGWMSKLEREAIPVITSLLSAQPLLGTALTVDHCSTLARWAFKTAIVRNLGTNYRKLIPPHHFTAAFDRRLLPPHTFVDLAVCPSYRKLGAVQSQTISGLLTRGDEELMAERREEMYNIVLGVGPLFLRVVYLPFPGYEVKPMLARDRRALRLWPEAMGGVLSLDNVVANLFDYETSTFFDETFADGAA